MDVRGAGAGQRLFGDAPLGAPVDESEPSRRIADRDIVGDRQVRNERQLLEDADDAGAIGGGGRVEGDLAAVEHDASFVRLHDAGQDS